TELEDPLGRGKILEPVHAEVAQPLRADEGSGRSRDQQLPPMAAIRNPGRTMDIHSDVVPLHQVCGARMHAHAYTKRTAAQSCERLGGRLDCTRRRRKGDEERVSLRVDLDPS